jgi:uncharacterized membrane protein YfcA
MDPINLLSLAFVVVYALILGLVAPYINLSSSKFGALVPTALAIVTGSLVWSILTWAGFHYDEAWIWLIVMLSMPVGMWLGAKRLNKIRS